MTVEGVFFFINDNNKKIKESRFLDKKKKNTTHVHYIRTSKSKAYA